MIKTIFYCIIYAILNVSGAAMIKLQLKNAKLSLFSDWVQFLLKFQVIIAFALIFISALAMFKALSTADFSLTIPIATGINFTLTVITGYFIFHDKMNLYSLIGFLLIFMGVLVLSLTTKYL